MSTPSDIAVNKPVQSQSRKAGQLTPKPVLCPAIFMAAPSSGEGKTTITAALARSFRNRGKVVRVFKTGPDYLDPQILSQASGQGVEPLDLWMAGEAYCRQKLYEAASVADLIIVEGAMGMFDGDPSSADLAARFNIPVVIVMNVKGMAQTAGAIAAGLANYRRDVKVAGLVANHCGTERHAELIRNALPDSIPLLATLARSEEVALPERHLGLVQANEVYDELEVRFERGVGWIGSQRLAELPRAVEFLPASTPQVLPLLAGKTIAVANDAAFSFVYDANLRLLDALGADTVFFSPLQDDTMPAADALWLPGGYPELHAEALSKNSGVMNDIKRFHLEGKPILAECGGFLYCLQSLTDLDGGTYPMAGLMCGEGAMRGKRGCQGMQTALLPEGEVRAHAHHRSRSANTPEAIAYGRRQRHPAPGEPIYRERGLTATYLHLFFASNPQAIADLFGAAVVGENDSKRSN